MSRTVIATEAYVYGITRADAVGQLDVSGVGSPPAPLRAVPHRHLAALVSAPPTANAEATREDLLAHARALEQVCERTTVLPMRFGMTLPSERSVVDDLLAPHYDRWERLLVEFHDAVEVVVKGFQDEDAALRRLVEEEPQIRRLRGRPALDERVRLGELVAHGLRRHRDAEAEWLLSRLCPRARAARPEPPALESMVLHAAFLVERDLLPAFDQEVARLGEEARDRLRLTCLGPQPPYAFVAPDREA